MLTPAVIGASIGGGGENLMVVASIAGQGPPGPHKRATGGTFEFTFILPKPANIEVWPESHWPGFALRQVDVLQSYTA